MEPEDKTPTGIPAYRIALYCILIAFGAVLLFKPEMFRGLLGPAAINVPIDDPSLKNVVLESKIPDDGRPVLLMLSSKTCGVCASIRPSMLRVARDYSSKVAIVDASVDEDYGYELADRFKISGVPTFYMIDPKHKIVGEFAGGVPEDYIRQQVEVLSKLKK